MSIRMLLAFACCAKGHGYALYVSSPVLYLHPITNSYW